MKKTNEERIIRIDTIDKFATLQEIPVFDGIPVENLWRLAEKSYLIEREKKGNDVAPPLIKEGETPATHFYILYDGVAELINANQPIKTLTKNAIYGENELIAGKEKYCNSIHLISPKTQFLKISKRRFMSIFDNFSEMSKNVCKLISDRYLINGTALAKEMEKNRNIDLIMSRFNKVSSELLRSMGRKEVEQKFLLKGDFRLKVFDDFALHLKKVEIEQAYLKIEKGEEIRIRKFGKIYFRTTKLDKEDQTRQEKEVRIEKNEFVKDYENILGTPIKKVRYQILNYPVFKEVNVDIYKGSLAPLKVAEIEYWGEEDVDNLEIPVWLQNYIERDVTTEPAYKNKNLSLNGLPKT